MVRLILVNYTITQMVQDFVLPQLHANIYIFYLVYANKVDSGGGEY
jgi:hypothetical protein